MPKNVSEKHACQLQVTGGARLDEMQTLTYLVALGNREVMWRNREWRWTISGPKRDRVSGAERPEHLRHANLQAALESWSARDLQSTNL
jgi:hypothetical protein